MNLVFKRQATCKISPLLLYPELESSRGLGGVLMEAAESEAVRRGSRQLYCTVAERNQDALRFFLQRGFAICGRSEGQYKEGETEVLLRRPLVTCPPGDRPDRESVISVVEVHEDDEWARVRELLLASMSPHVEGADHQWLDALRSGRSWIPTDSFVFCARDRGGAVRAAAVAAAKKGDSVKVMPIAAADAEAFKALIIDLPSLLADKGRKAFMHISPAPEQVAILQESSWTFEAQLPGAYSRTSVTQQWGCPLGKDAQLNLRIHNNFLTMIESGKKTLEIRVGYKHIRRIGPGADICLVSRDRTLCCRVVAVRGYRTFAEMLRHEEVDRALPGMDPGEALAQLRQIYPPAKERLGVVVIELDPMPMNDKVHT